MTEQTSPSKLTLKATLRDTWRYFKRTTDLLGKGKRLYWPSLLLYSSQNFVMNLMTSWLMAQIIASAIAQSMTMVTQTLLTFLALFLGYFLILIPGVLYAVICENKVTGILMNDAYDHLIRMPLSRMKNVGDALSRIENDLPKTASLAGTNIGNYLMPLLGGLGASVVIFSIHPLIFAVGLVSGIFAFVMEALLVAPTRRVNDQIQQHQAEKTEVLDDIIQGGLTVRLYNLQESMDRKLWQRLWSIVRENMKLYRLGMLSALGSNISQWSSLIGVIITGLWLALEGTITVENAVLASGMASSLSWLFTSISANLKSVQTMIASALRTYEIIDAPAEDDRRGAAGGKIDPDAPFLACQDLYFAYQDGQSLLQGIDFTVNRGQTLALVGESGSGKSTLLRVLMNLYLPQQGRVVFSGIPCEAMSLDDWRRHFAYVPQDSPLFDGTIADNIALGRPGATREEIEEAARSAYAHDFITALPHGYDTTMGEGATMISGGQRQRIAIARALLRDAPILLLDEATSSLDTQSEKEVQAALEKLMSGRATVVVAHRLSTIRRADTILVIEHGRVVESGSHDQLLEASGPYAAMVQAGSLA